MVKDIIVTALYMLGLHAKAGLAEKMTGGTDEYTERFVRFFNLVVDEIAAEYRKGATVSGWYAFLHAPPVFAGISERVLAYGVAAEYCITEGIDEAVTWDKRYKDALAAAPKQSRTVKPRKFIL